MDVTETRLADIEEIRDELLEINHVIAITERTAERAEDDFAWRLSLQGFYGLRAQRLEELTTAAQAGDEALQRAALRALGKAGGEEAVPALAEALRSRSANIRQEAIWALSEVGSESALPPLARALRSQDPLTRELAARAIGRIGTDSAVDVLSEAARREQPERVLTAIVGALEFIGTPRAREALPETEPLSAASR